MKQVLRIISIVCTGVCVLCCISSGQAPFPCYATEVQPETWEKNTYISRSWECYKNSAEDQWVELKGEQDQEWKRLRAQVEKKWQEFVHSTEKEWVEYGWARDVRSRVDFEKGRILFEAVVGEGRDARKKAQEKIKNQATKILGKTRESVLQGQVKDRGGEEIAPNNVNRYLEEEVIPKVRRDSQPYVSRDGVERRRYSVSIKMVPDHLRIRAMRYLPIVQKNAERFDVMPELILAIIHTESCFNPMAISRCGAIGLMQIIPKYAGREASLFIYKDERPVTPEYLFDPEKNVELGVAYLHLLKYRYFVDIKDDTKKRYFSICGYNWGPRAVRKNILEKHAIDKLTCQSVYFLLKNRAPNETGKYMERVVSRIPVYSELL